MGIVDKLANRFGYQRAPAAPGKRRKMNIRGFAGGEYSRLTHSWTMADGAINNELYQSLRVMRARSRDLAANNEFAANFFRQCKINIAGPTGFTFRSRARRSDGSLDMSDNRLIEERLRHFSKRGNFDTSGRLSRASSERLIVETMARDGEYLAIKEFGFDNPHRFALRFVDVDRLDLNANKQRDPKSGLRVIMGVEVDDYYRPHYYWILRRHPNGGELENPAGQTHDRIPAANVIHDFVSCRPEQVRGFPWIHAGMVGLWDIGGYREAAIVNARVGANKLGLVIGGDPDDETAAGLATDVDHLGQTLSDSEPGEWHRLPEDVSVETYDPTYPHAMFEQFNSALLHGVAAAFGLANHSLTGDLSQVNFATGKISQIPERDMWISMQTHVAEGFGDNWFPDWLRQQLAGGLIPPIPAGAFERKNAPLWRGRRWQSVEPLKDAQANAIRVGMRELPLRTVIENSGEDADLAWATMAEDNETLTALGLPPTFPTSITLQNAEATDNAE